MPQLGKLLTELLTVAGVDMTQTEIAPLLVLDTNVPDETATALKTNLMTVESAKNNPTLKSHFTASALNAVDTELNDLVKEFGFSDADLSKFKAEQSTYKRVGLVARRLKELEKEAAAAGGGGTDDPALKEAHDKMKLEVDRLNSEMAGLRTSNETALNDARAGFESELVTEGLNSLLGSKKYANKEIDTSTNVTLARTLLMDQLKNDGITLVRRDGKIVMVRTDNPELDYMAENKKVELGSYADKLLGAKKLIEVTPADPNPRGGNTDTIIKTDLNGNDNTPAIPASAASHYEQELAALGG